MDTLQRDRLTVWHPYTQAGFEDPPIPIERASGVYLYDQQGRAYLDAISSWWVNLHGHAHPHIAARVAAQLQQLEHVMFAGFTHEPAVRLAERLLAILPSNQRRIFFSDNGSTAVEAALKIALQYWHNRGEPRTEVLAFEHSYHGDTFGAMSIGAEGGFFKPFEPFLFKARRIPPPMAGQVQRSLEDLERLLERLRPALFIFEPLVQCAGGMVMHSGEALSELIGRCRRAGVITIADEVAVGFGRTGTFFASDQLAEKPDMICLSKGLTGGTLPLAVTACAEFLFEAFLGDDRSKALMHGHSYTANPTGCAAAHASLDLLERPECWQRISAIHESHQRFVNRLRELPTAANPRVCGTILAFDVVTGGSNSYFNPVRDSLYRSFIESGVLLRPLGNVVYVMPPYCITDEELERVYRTLWKALEKA